jgi:predicted transcriptional regulator
MKEFLNCDDIAEILKVKKTTVQKLFNYGTLKGKKIANRWVITLDKFKAYIDS